MRHWYLSLCMGGVWSAGWSFSEIYLQDCTRMHSQQNIKNKFSLLYFVSGAYVFQVMFQLQLKLIKIMSCFIKSK
jgi:hypothetical protein